MTLRVIFADKKEEFHNIIKLFTVKTAEGDFLYYESAFNEEGKGNVIALEEIKCWEVIATNVVRI